ncbi:hypothetical protein [Paraburkholderia sp. RL17-373-BIF-A]|uniref:hypothetical protein n=1 Tax=Paraburkholderia sp. RL17-373-BIF-A TaxID=3031629 RepID=UPI0038B8B0CF
MYRLRPGRSRIACSFAAGLACDAFGARNTELMPGRLIGSAPGGMAATLDAMRL